MNTKIIIYTYLCLFSLSLSGMEKSTCYRYRQAEQSDVAAILDLINTKAICDKDRIVILPEIFRKHTLQKNIELQRMFIVEDNGLIIGYKKLFIMHDDEKADILDQEIRCINNEKNCTFAGYIDDQGICIEDKSSTVPNDCYHVCIYNGGDFTHPNYRKQGVNQRLTTFALMSILAKCKKRIDTESIGTISMVYGITEANAGEKPGAPTDRTITIQKSFAAFIQVLKGGNQSMHMHYHRYRAFMPTFDPHATILQPLSEEQSVPGFGCVLACQLRGSHE